MRQLRLLLLPFAWIYGSITAVRNLLYSIGVFKSYRISGKSIIVGNLSTGGTGKTPLVDYLIRHFLNEQVQLSTLSRGYGRKTKGLAIATTLSNSDEVGDEPLQYKLRHKDRIHVVCHEKRAEGVQYIQSHFKQNQLIILDDAFQHRAVSAGLNILVTPYNDLYSKDFALPAGNLREFRIGAKRADIVIVSKCPSSLTLEDQKRIKSSLNFQNENVFFSSIEYGKLEPFEHEVASSVEHILLVTGIGNPTPLLKHLETQAKIEHIAFKDHHEFTEGDIQKIHEKFDIFASRNKIIVTTEKDFARLKKFKAVFDKNYPWCYQPITLKIKNEQQFKSLLNEYFRQV